MTIKRYDEIAENGFSSMFESSDGEYVLYEDVVEILEGTLAENIRLRKDLKLSLEEIENYRLDL